MISLPPVQGRFPVGVTTFVTPVRPSRSIGPTRLKISRNLKPGLTNHALQLEEVAFTAYYPADTSNSPSKGVDWLFRPLSASLLGLSTYLGISTWLLWPAVYFFGSLIKIPAYRNAPLLHPDKAENNSENQWPLVIFSHGLGGSRTTYSHFCSRLAASGKVVLALEHRDGTGMACVPRLWKAGDKVAHRTMVYLREADISWDDNKLPEGPMPFRRQQLAFRHHEIHIMYEAFRKFLDRDPQVELETIDASLFDNTSWTALTSSKTSVIKHSEDIILTGHSFGGATALSLLATKPADNYERIPISKVIVLDPWLEPLPTPGPAPYSAPDHPSREDVASAEASIQESLNGTAVVDSDASLSMPKKHPKLFVINSETFTIWTDHFARLQEIVNTWEPQGHRIVTLIGSKHVSFSDFTILPGLRKKHDVPIHDTICRLSLAFIHDELDEVLTETPTTEMKIEVVGQKPDGKPKRKMTGNIGDVVIS